VSAEDVFEDVLEDVVGEKPLVNFFLLYGVSVRLYVRSDSLAVSRTFEPVTWGLVCMVK
jgi:hypothetical protein